MSPPRQIIMLLRKILAIWNFVIRCFSFLLEFFLRVEIRRRSVVGIFSREGDNCYKFLIEFLSSSEDVSIEVRPVFIGNDGWREIIQEVRRCQVAILYHSKKRGRVNITDVTDSLYDQELEHFNQQLGMSNVMVVADDLDDSSLEEKERILQNQHKIRDMASDLFLLSKMDKVSGDHMNEKLQEILTFITQRSNISIDPRRGREIPVITFLTVWILRILFFVLKYIMRYLIWVYRTIRGLLRI